MYIILYIHVARSYQSDTHTCICSEIIICGVLDVVQLQHLKRLVYTCQRSYLVHKSLKRHIYSCIRSTHALRRKDTQTNKTHTDQTIKHKLDICIYNQGQALRTGMGRETANGYGYQLSKGPKSEKHGTKSHKACAPRSTHVFEDINLLDLQNTAIFTVHLSGRGTHGMRSMLGGEGGG